MQHYGNGPSTDLDQTASGKISTGLVPADVFIAPADRDVLVRLGWGCTAGDGVDTSDRHFASAPRAARPEAASRFVQPHCRS